MATSVGILIRASSDKQDEANQVPELEHHCADNGYRINKRYEVHDRSAYKGEHEPWLDEVLVGYPCWCHQETSCRSLFPP